MADSDATLDEGEVRRRMVAARMLAGEMSQAQLGTLFKRDGLGTEDVGKLERGEKVLRDAHIDSMVRHLGVPRQWFTEPDLPAWLRAIASPQLEVAELHSMVLDLWAESTGRTADEARAELQQRDELSSRRPSARRGASPGND